MNLSVKTHGPQRLCEPKRHYGFYLSVLPDHKGLFMRLFILTIFLTFHGLLLANTSRGQELDKIIVSVDFKNVTLKVALRKIESLSKLPFAYQTNDIAGYKDISYQGTRVPLTKVLEEVLRNTGLRYEVVHSNVIIKKVKTYASPDVPGQLYPAAMMLDFDGGIKGKVTNQRGVPLPNASIIVRGISKGTAAGTQGEFNISGLKAGSYSLQVSAVGFKTVERVVTVRDNEVAELTFQLEETDASLSEVIVTALGINRKQRSLGYATQEVKGENLTLAKEQNVIGSLSGKIAGVMVSGSSAASMGGTQKIQIRGVNSVTGGGDPLIVIDNTPVSNTNFADKNGRDYGNLAQDINPDDIESINVLKGPAAAALYGLRGQFGVIMITTKKGSRTARKPVVNFSSSFSTDVAGNFMPLQDIYGAGSSLNFPTVTINGVKTKYVDGTWDESWGPKMDGTPVRHQYSFYPADPEFGKETPFIPHPDNIKDYFETGRTLNNSISVAGGGPNTSFRLSYNYTTIKGIEPNTHLKRNNLSFNGSINVLDNLVISTGLNYANNSGLRPSQGYQSLGSRNMYQWFQRNLDMNRLKQYKYSDGTFYQWNVNDPEDGVYNNMTPIDWNNPYFDAYENTSHDSRDRFFGNVGVTYTILPGWQVSGFIRRDGFTQNLDGRNAAGGRGIPSFWIGKYESAEMNYELLSQYSKEFGEFSLNANVGGNIMTQKYTYLRQETKGGLATPDWYNIANSIERPDVTNYLRRKEVRSAFASASIGFRNTWFVDASVRRDISSALPSDNNDYIYPSVSTSFVFSELIPSGVISYGKLRASFAQAGSDVAVYQTTNAFVLGDPYGTSFPMYVPDKLNNPGLVPSLGTSLEAGLDMRFWKDRLGFNVTVYQQKNKREVMNLDVPGPSGYTSYAINAGNIENKGIEFTLNATPVQTKSIKWTTTFNIAHNKSKILELFPGSKTLVLDQNRYASVDMFLLANEGEAFGSLVGNGYQRDPATGKILLDAANMPMWSTNHNFGTVLPKFTGGWQHSVSWKKFDLSLAMDFQSGGQFFSWTKMLAVKSGQAAETAVMNDKGKNIRDPLADGGGVKVTGISNATKQEVTAYVNARTYYRNTLGNKIYEEWLFDASYIRMREMRLGYTFARDNYPKLPFSSINIAFITRNPFTIWQKAPKGLNPGELATGATSLNWLETGQLATVRSYGINLNVSF